MNTGGPHSQFAVCPCACHESGWTRCEMCMSEHDGVARPSLLEKLVKVIDAYLGNCACPEGNPCRICIDANTASDEWARLYSPEAYAAHSGSLSSLEGKKSAPSEAILAREQLDSGSQPTGWTVAAESCVSDLLEEVAELRERLVSLTQERDRYYKALDNHLCGGDMADWVACSGHPKSACIVCEEAGDHGHKLLERAETAEERLSQMEEAIRKYGNRECDWEYVLAKSERT